MYRDVLKIFLLYRLTRSVVNIGGSYVIEYVNDVHEFCKKKFKLVSWILVLLMSFFSSRQYDILLSDILKIKFTPEWFNSYEIH